LGEDKGDSCIGFNEDAKKNSWRCLEEKDMLLSGLEEETKVCNYKINV